MQNTLTIHPSPAVAAPPVVHFPIGPSTIAPSTIAPSTNAPSTIAPSTNATTSIAAPNKAPAISLLQQYLPDTVGQIEHASSAPADLIAYQVRQALNDGLTTEATQQLLAVINARPVSAQTYTRHVLHADSAGRFTVVALVWGPEHSSPVHAHHTWCTYRVLSGELSESHFEWDASQQKAYLFNKVKRQSGQSVCGNSGLSLIHRLGNESPQRAVSIHVYGVDAESISTHVNHVLPWVQNV